MANEVVLGNNANAVNGDNGEDSSSWKSEGVVPDDHDNSSITRNWFPGDFVSGTGTAAFQMEAKSEDEVERLQQLTQIVIESESKSEIIVEIPSDDDPTEAEVKHDSPTPPNSGSSLDEPTDWLEKHRGTVMNLSTFLGGIAYAAGLNPPGGILAPHTEDKATYKLGVSMLAANNAAEFKTFCFLNVVVLLASFTTVLLLLTGIPSSRRLALSIITVMTAIAMIAAVVNVLLITINVFMPPNLGASADVVSIMLNYIMFVWCGIITLVVIAYLVKVVKSQRRTTLKHDKNV